MFHGKCWTKEEDQLLKHLFEEREIQKWSNIAEKINETFLFPIKTGKQCRQRYYNSLAPFINKKNWTEEEEQELFRLHDQFGNKWTQIASKLPGRYVKLQQRAHNCVKNRFYAQIRKSLRKLNKWQKILKIKSVKHVKVERIKKILSLGYSSDTEETKNHSLSHKCLYIKKELIEFHQLPHQSENFKEKIIELYKSISALSTDLKGCRIPKNKKKHVFPNQKHPSPNSFNPNKKDSSLPAFQLKDQGQQKQQDIKKEEIEEVQEKNIFPLSNIQSLFPEEFGQINYYPYGYPSTQPQQFIPFPYQGFNPNTTIFITDFSKIEKEIDR